jgi:hypothetical protein
MDIPIKEIPLAADPVFPAGHGLITFKSREDFLEIFSEMEEDSFLVCYIWDGYCYNVGEKSVMSYPYREDGSSKA